jgi:hypothetical protein
MDGQIVERTAVMFGLGWLASFKVRGQTGHVLGVVCGPALKQAGGPPPHTRMQVLAFCLDRGPLAARWNAPQTAAIYVLPIYPSPPRDAASTKAAGGAAGTGGASGRLNDSAGHPLQLFALWIVKGCVFGGVVAVLSTGVGGLARDTLQALGMYCFVSLLMDGPASLMSPLLGLKIIPTFGGFGEDGGDGWRRQCARTCHSPLSPTHTPGVCVPVPQLHSPPPPHT